MQKPSTQSLPDGQKRDLPGGKTFGQQLGEHRDRFLRAPSVAATASPRAGQSLGLRVIVVCRGRGPVAAQLSAHRRTRTPQGVRDGSSAASGFAGAKLQAVDVGFMPLDPLFCTSLARQVPTSVTLDPKKP